MSFLIEPLKSEVVPEPRSGHVSVYYKGLFVVIGGYYEADVSEEVEDEEILDDTYYPANVIWFYNVEKRTWIQREAMGDIPEGFVGACACVVEDTLYLFAGFKEYERYTCGLYLLDMATLTWRDVTDDVSGSPSPSPRDKFGCWTWRDRTFYFGGFGEPPNDYSRKGDNEEFVEENGGLGWNNELYMLQCKQQQQQQQQQQQLTWTKCRPTGTTPHPRAAFAYTQISSYGYLFGGRFQAGRRNDMYRLDLEHLVWQEIVMPAVSVPVGRSWHVMCAVSNRHLMVYGGMDTQSKTLDDVWVYDIDANTWQETETGASCLGTHALRLWHTGCSTDTPGEVLVFGGSACQGFLSGCSSHVNSVAVFRFSPLPLKRLCAEKLASL